MGQRALWLLSRATSIIVRIVEILTCLFLAAVVLIHGLELLARNFFNYSYVWAHEVNILLANWVYFLGICIVYHLKGDVSVTFFARALAPPYRRAWAVFCHLVSGAVFAIIAFYGWELVKLQAPYRTTGLGIPNMAFSLPVVISGVVLVVITLRHAVEAWTADEPPMPPLVPEAI